MFPRSFPIVIHYFFALMTTIIANDFSVSLPLFRPLQKEYVHDFLVSCITVGLQRNSIITVGLPAYVDWVFHSSAICERGKHHCRSTAQGPK